MIPIQRTLLLCTKLIILSDVFIFVFWIVMAFLLMLGQAGKLSVNWYISYVDDGISEE
jgi:hypothetical protein